MFQDVIIWLKTCKGCKKAKSPYLDPNVKQIPTIANNLMNLLCLDFTTLDPSEDEKENDGVHFSILLQQK